MFTNILELFGDEKTVRKIIYKNNNIAEYYNFNNDIISSYYDGYLSRGNKPIKFCYGKNHPPYDIPIVDLYVKLLTMEDKGRLIYNTLLKKYTPSSLRVDGMRVDYILYNISSNIRRLKIDLDPILDYHWFEIETKDRNINILLTKDPKSFNEALVILNRNL